jgi:hypothetical protein
MNAMRKCVVVLPILAMGGCGGDPRLDTTNKQTYEASRKAIEAGMTDAQKREFARDTMAALGPAAVQAAMKKNFSNTAGPANPADMYKPLNGMTAEEIHAKALAASTKLEASKKK